MSTPFDITVYNKLGKEDLQKFVFNKIYQQISNSTVLQLNNLREKHSLPVSYLLKWVGQLTGKDLPLDHGNCLQLNRAIRHLLSERSYLIKKRGKNLKTEELSTFLSAEFDKFATIATRHRHKKSLEKTLSKPKRIQPTKSALNETNKEIGIQLKSELNKLEKDNAILQKKLTLAKNRIRLLKNTTLHSQKRLKSLTKLVNEQKETITNIRNVNRHDRKLSNQKIVYWEIKTNNLRSVIYKLKQQNISNEIKHANEISQFKSRVNQLQKEKKIVETELDWLGKTEQEIDLTVPAKNGKYTYNSKTDLCIFELLQNHVPFDRIGNVIRSVLKLADIKIKYERVPKKDYVADVNIRSGVLSQNQISEKCTEKQDQTLYSDETRKNGNLMGLSLQLTKTKMYIFLDYVKCPASHPQPN